MLITRPIRKSDLDPLLDLASLTGFGLTTLPRDRELLEERIIDSEHAFLRQAPRPRGDVYLFVMEDTDKHRVVGTCGISSKVGGFEPFYAYRLQTTIRQSEMLKVTKNIQTLTLVQEHNGPCEIGSLFLHPEYRHHAGAGRLLSLSRFLFIAEYPKRFDPTVIAEMRGVIDNHGRSPFWDAIGKHFFDIDFPKADYLSMVNKTFIADLMPQHPIYVTLLPPEAQAVIGKVHPDTKPALNLLLSEGFHLTEDVDIFEAGPVVEVKRDDIRTLRESRRAVVDDITSSPLTTQVVHILNPAESRSARAPVEEISEGLVRINQPTAQALNLAKGGAILYAPTHASAVAGQPPNHWNI